MKRTICIDFDGVLHSYSKGWQGATVLELPVPGAQAFVRRLQSLGFEVVIQSTRAATSQGYAAIRGWLHEHHFTGDITVTHEKPMAVLYVDDRGYRFTGSFDEVESFMAANPELGTWNHPRR
jgi:hypothetical protein